MCLQTFSYNAGLQLLQIYLRSNLFYIWQCVCVCMFAIGARIFEATELEFGMEKGFHPGKVLALVWANRTSPPGQGRPISASGGLCSPNSAFQGQLYKTKVEEHPLI